MGHDFTYFWGPGISLKPSTWTSGSGLSALEAVFTATMQKLPGLTRFKVYRI